jgi:hypothetical protein
MFTGVCVCVCFSVSVERKHGSESLIPLHVFSLKPHVKAAFDVVLRWIAFCFVVICLPKVFPVASFIHYTFGFLAQCLLTFRDDQNQVKGS